jgi:hypothetical protein
MSYLTVAACVADADLTNRIRACYADEGGDVNTIAPGVFWSVATAADVEAAYAAALAAGTDRPGADEAAVTDGMILANVQPLVIPAG